MIESSTVFGPLAMSVNIVENCFPGQHQSFQLNDETTLFLFDRCLVENSGHICFALSVLFLPSFKHFFVICAKLNL